MAPLRLVDPGLGRAAPGCDGKHDAHGLCQAHARKLGLYQLTPDEVVVLYSSPPCASCGRPRVQPGTPNPSSTTTTTPVPSGASRAGPATSCSAASVMTPTDSGPPPATSSRPHRRARRRKRRLTGSHRGSSSRSRSTVLEPFEDLGWLTVMAPATPWTRRPLTST